MKPPRPPGSRLDERFRAPLFILAVFLLAFSTLCGKTLIYRDAHRLFAPYKFLIAQSLRSGELPAWNPHQFLGLPFAADILAGCFYPLNLLYALLPFAAADRLFIVLHFPLAALGLYLLLRELGLRDWAGLFAGLSFACSGYLVNQAANLPYLIGPAYAPLALWAALKRDRALSWGLVSGAILALQVLAGEPQSAAITAVLVLAVYLGEAARSHEYVRGLARAGTCILSALGLSMIQILPTLEILNASFRKEGLGFEEASFFSFHPARLVELVWPAPFGALFPKTTFWGAFAVEPSPMNIQYPWSIQNYAGLAVVLLAVCGLLRAGRRLRYGMGAGAIVFLLLSLGHHAPFFRWFHAWVPLSDIFRYPSKYLAYFMLFLAMAAGAGLDFLLGRLEEQPRRGRTWALGLLLAVAAVFAAGMALFPAIVEGLGGLRPGTPPYQEAFAGILAGGLRLLAVNAILAGGLLLFSLGRLSLRILMPAMALVMLADWSSVNFAGLPAAEVDDTVRPFAARAIAPEGRPLPGAYRIHREDFGFRDLSPVPGAFLERSYRNARDTLLSNHGDREGFESLLGFNEIVPKEGLPLLDSPRARTLEVFNVSYLLSKARREPVTAVSNELLVDDVAHDVSLRRLPGAFPRAYWVPGAVAAPDTAKAMELFSGTDLTRRVILTTNEPLPADGPEGALLPVAMSAYTPDRVLLDVDAPAAGWLVLSDRFYPGWFAEIDGRPAKIFRANALVRAIRVPGGRHQARFEFRPPSLRVGARISAASWLLFLGVIAGAAVRRRRVRPS